MPLTPSHAIVALPFVRGPLARTGLVPAAVAVGAMAPDTPLFVEGSPLTYEMTHDFRWLPVTVLLSLALLLLWRCVLRPAARELLPRRMAGRLPAEWDERAAASLREVFAPGRRGVGILLLVVALALGVATHIVWDSFTHQGRAGTVLIPALSQQWGPLPGYRWMQFGSSVVGLIVLAIAAVVWFRGRPVVPVVRSVPDAVRVVWWVSILVPLLVGVAALIPVRGPVRLEQVAYAVLPPLLGAWALLTVVLCIVVQARSRPAAV